MVLICLVMIAGLMLFGGFTTTNYIIKQKPTTTTTSTTTTTTTSTTTTTTTSTTTTTTTSATISTTKNTTKPYDPSHGAGGSETYGYPATTTQNPANRTNRLEKVNLRYYNGPSVTDYEDIPLSESKRLFKLKYFKPKIPTMMYVHGYLDVPDQESIEVIVKAYLDMIVVNQISASNIILLDWTNMAHGNYLTNAGPNAKIVGEAVAVQFNQLIKLGLDLERIHIIGHSLGSHVAGYIARVLKNKYKKLVKRVTALDPVFPGFYPSCENMQHISADDAELVDVIHTDAGGFGAPYETGTADFWPNGGQRIQPGCPKYSRRDLIHVHNLCSHLRSWRYYAESVRYPKAFPASPHKIDMFTQNRYYPMEIVYMGYLCDKNAVGSFVLRTNGYPPFGMGMHE